MNRIITRGSIAFALLILANCASPKVVQEKQVGDTSMSCKELADAQDEARTFENKARAERGVTGTNAAAVILFWPALVATYSNSGDAISAAQERQHYLGKIYDQKNCDAQLAADKAAAEKAILASASPPTPTASAAPAEGGFVVSSLSGAGAFKGQEAIGEPLGHYANGESLTVIEATSDNRWYKVMLKDGRTGYVASALVKSSPGSAAATAAETDEPKEKKLAGVSKKKHGKKPSEATTSPSNPETSTADAAKVNP